MPRFKTQRDVEEAVAVIENLRIPGVFPTLEALQAQRETERQLACLELEEMAQQFKREEEKRKQLWGSKFPRVLGAVPPTKPEAKEKSNNPVKRKKSGKTK